MMEEYQAQSQQVQDELEPLRQTLEDMLTHLGERYPEEERTYRMGRAMGAISSAHQLVLNAQNTLHSIEWPTEDRPR